MSDDSPPNWLRIKSSGAGTQYMRPEDINAVSENKFVAHGDVQGYRLQIHLRSKDRPFEFAFDHREHREAFVKDLFDVIEGNTDATFADFDIQDYK